MGIRRHLWSLSDVQVGDHIVATIVNDRGDRNLDGQRLAGEIKAIVPEHQMVRLDDDWCVHTTDRLISIKRKTFSP